MSELSFMEKLLDGVKVEWHVLGDMTEYSPTRVDAAVLDKASFVGVDNLVAEKGGRVDANYLPNTTRLTAYEPGDILIGNIRPYLKKVWRATNSGGCSGDVLAVRIQENNKPFVDSAFLYYLLSSDDFFSYNMQHAKGAKMPRGDKSAILKYQIPIPCPDNPAKSLEIQSKIVRILDTFTELTAELTAELSLRKKQYNHYRDQLLSFEEGEVEWRTLGELATLRRGRVMSKGYIEENAGVYPVFSSQTARNGMIGSIDTFDFDGNFISWTTDGVNAGTVFYRTGKFSITNVCGLVKIKNKSGLSYKFLYYWLSTEAKKHVYSGMGNPKLMSHQVEKIPVPIPYPNNPRKSLDEQERTVTILDKLEALTFSITEGLPREIELRQKQYEYYRDLLLSFPKPDASKSEAAA